MTLCDISPNFISCQHIKFAVILLMTVILFTYTFQCNWVTSLGAVAICPFVKFISICFIYYFYILYLLFLMYLFNLFIYFSIGCISCHSTYDFLPHHLHLPLYLGHIRGLLLSFHRPVGEGRRRRQDHL